MTNEQIEKLMEFILNQQAEIVRKQAEHEAQHNELARKQAEKQAEYATQQAETARKQAEYAAQQAEKQAEYVAQQAETARKQAEKQAEYEAQRVASEIKLKNKMEFLVEHQAEHKENIQALTTAVATLAIQADQDRAEIRFAINNLVNIVTNIHHRVIKLEENQ